MIATIQLEFFLSVMRKICKNVLSSFSFWSDWVFMQGRCVEKNNKALDAVPNSVFNHSDSKHDRGTLFLLLFSFRIIRSRSTGSI